MIKRFFRKLKRIDYRHYICLAITVACVLCSVFVFPHALGRIIEGGRDLGLSVAYYFAELFELQHGIAPTVTTFAKQPYFSWLSSPIATPTLPESWSAFVADWHAFWQLFATWDNFTSYLGGLIDIVELISLLLLPLVAVILLFRVVINSYLNKQNNKYNADSRPLRIFKKITNYTYRPVKAWLISFWAFVRANPFWLKTWLIIWAYNFNFITIVLEFFAYFFYFSVSFDLLSIYTQVYKLICDLWAVIMFVPSWLWLLFALVVLHAVSKRVAYAKLYHNERRNRGFINELGMMTFAVGSMGVGKTLQITDWALSFEAKLLDQAFEIILEEDMKFPYFPWCYLEQALKRAMANHYIYDLSSTRRWVRHLAFCFYAAQSGAISRNLLLRHLRKSKEYQLKYKNFLFDYDYDRYGLTYDNKLFVSDIWESIENYACAYFIYTVQSSYMIANYSIRSDKIMSDIGNFPLWNTDFFKRDSRLLDSFSRHAHILDYDMLRLGKRMLGNNPNRNAFGFGVYVISEIDKERKNTLELQDVKRNADECNQKNDLTNVLLKMSRHACVVSNRVFATFLADLQRPTSLGADALQLGDVVYIKSKGEMLSVLPFYSPFHLVELLCRIVIPHFNDFYKQYRYNRADNTLFMYCVKGFVAKLNKWVSDTNNLFSSQTLKLQIIDGMSLDDDKAEVRTSKYFRMPKKVFSRRYSTDCLSGIFEARSAYNSVGIDDLAEYADIMANSAELQMQQSHFQKDISKINTP